ncbi:hypothetical protein Z043_117148 [Scleropages formosus]|uniref:Uncharacterized protein n=1 Tax=Scleropages formosus TaxID=113540 RepID=A0A0P7UA72_SCLFO|nr:hypothetical protein Z043_117148 [Scleropages formosus]
MGTASMEKASLAGCCVEALQFTESTLGCALPPGMTCTVPRRLPQPEEVRRPLSVCAVVPEGRHTSGTCHGSSSQQYGRV